MDNTVIKFIKETLDVKDTSGVDNVVLIGLAILYLAFRREHIGMEVAVDFQGNIVTPPLEAYLYTNDIPFSKPLIDKAYTILEENKLLDGYNLNCYGTENVQEKVTWLFWSFVLKGYLKRRINSEQNEAEFTVTPQGEAVAGKALEEMKMKLSKK